MDLLSPARIPLPRLLVTLQRALLSRGTIVDVGEWQGIKGGPTARTLELQNISFRCSIPATVAELVEQVRPNLPWAEDHFGERIGGEPLNPPPSSAYWPFTQRGHSEHVDEDGKFSHTYPERFWPRYVNVNKPDDEGGGVSWGLRYRLGDLDDVVKQLEQSLYTRQAFIPIWFPEDTGATSGQRVPCTIGYHMLVRNNAMQCTYYIRSCDLLRHFVDDVYMAMRLTQWLCTRLQRISPGLQPRQLIMHVASLHVFESDVETLRYRFGIEERRFNGR